MKKKMCGWLVIPSITHKCANTRAISVSVSVPSLFSLTHDPHSHLDKVVYCLHVGKVVVIHVHTQAKVQPWKRECEYVRGLER